jgi:hypothetical protein
MPENEPLIYLMLDEAQGCDEELIKKYRKEIDGLSYTLTTSDRENIIDILRSLKNCVASEGLKMALILSSHEIVGKELKDFLEDVSDLTIFLPDPEGVPKVRELFKRSTIGIKINNPFPNFAVLKSRGVDAVLMPHSLVKGRVVKEAKAKNIRVFSLLVNDAATYLKMKTAGVDAVITEKPLIAKEALKLRI